MKHSTLSIAPIILALSLGNAHAADYDTAHTFAAGDVISADMMNELFDYIKQSKQAVTAKIYLAHTAVHRGLIFKIMVPIVVVKLLMVRKGFILHNQEPSLFLQMEMERTPIQLVQ